MMIVDVLLFVLKKLIIESKIALSFINALLPTSTITPRKGDKHIAGKEEH